LVLKAVKCCYGRLKLLECSYSADTGLTLVKTVTPKLGGKGGAKPHCDSLMLGESPASLVGWSPAYFLLLEHCKIGRMEARTWSFLFAS